MSQKTTKTYAELLALVKALNSTKCDNGTKREVKVSKIINKIKPIFEEYDEKRKDIIIDNAHTNDKGVLELNQNGDYTFTKEGIKSVNKGVKELLESTFEFYQFSFSTEGIEDLEFLHGWVEGITKNTEEDEQVQQTQREDSEQAGH